MANEPWLEPPPQAGQDGHLKDHTNWREWFRTFWEDVKLGNYPGLIGPEGPEGPQGKPGVDGKPGADGNDGKPGQDGADGSDGSDGKDGVTPTAAHWRHNYVFDQPMNVYTVHFNKDDFISYWDGNQDTVYVYVNGVLMMSDDYGVTIRQLTDGDWQLVVAMSEGFNPDDVLDVIILFPFSVINPTSTSGDYVENRAVQGEANLPGGIQAISQLDAKRDSYQSQHINTLFVVWDGTRP